MDESIDLESLVNYHQFTGLERLVKYHQLVTEFDFEPLGNVQVLAEESEIVAANEYFHERGVLRSVAELLRPDREPDIVVDGENWWKIAGALLCICNGDDSDGDDSGCGWVFPAGDEPPAVHAHLEEDCGQLRDGQGKGPGGLKLV